MPETILPDAGSEHQSRPRAGRRSTPTCRSWKRTPEHHALGRALLELRARRGLSQEQLGFDARLHRNYVGALERGEINPTFRVLLKLATGLRLPLSELIGVYERQRAETSSNGPHKRNTHPTRDRRPRDSKRGRLALSIDHGACPSESQSFSSPRPRSTSSVRTASRSMRSASSLTT